MLRNNKFKSILTNTDSPQKVLPDSNNKERYLFVIQNILLNVRSGVYSIAMV